MYSNKYLGRPLNLTHVIPRKCCCLFASLFNASAASRSNRGGDDDDDDEMRTEWNPPPGHNASLLHDTWQELFIFIEASDYPVYPELPRKGNCRLELLTGFINHIMQHCKKRFETV